jgi:hypothetical protein
MRTQGYYWAKDDRDIWLIVHWDGYDWREFHETEPITQREMDLIYCYISETPIPTPQ